MAKLVLEESPYAARTEVPAKQDTFELFGGPAAALATIKQRVSSMVWQLVELAMAQCAVVEELTRLGINVQAATGNATDWQVQPMEDPPGYRILVHRLSDSSDPTSIIGLEQAPHGTWRITLLIDVHAIYPSEVQSGVINLLSISPGAKAAHVLDCIRKTNKQLELLFLQQVQC